MTSVMFVGSYRAMARIASSWHRTVALPRGSSDASLGPYHVDRSKIFAHERLEHSPLDAARIARAIEFTRFPTGDHQAEGSEDLEPRLVQAADLIGQLAGSFKERGLSRG